MGIQLEVNAEIFTTIYNLLSNMRSEEGIQQEDENAFSIYGGKRFAPWPRWNSAKVMGFLWKNRLKCSKRHMPSKRSTRQTSFFFRELLQTDKRRVGRSPTFFRRRDEYPFQLGYLACHDKGQNRAQENPTAFIIAGQPGSGKTRMSSVIIDDYDGDIIQSMSDNFRGFHPRAKEVFQKYGRYCTYFSTKEGKYLSDLAMRKAAEEKYHILQEGSLDDSAHTMALISYLKEKGYTICVLLRACLKKDSWKAIHQLYLQQRLKAPGLSRLISKEQHDKACLSFLSATNDLIDQNLMDRLIIKSPKGLLYDSDDMPTERVSDVLSKRIGK